MTGAGIAIGGHTTAGAQSNGYTNPETGAPQTGCGAGEKHIGSTTRLVKGDANVLRLTDAMLGQGDNDIFVSETTMSARNADYDPRTMLDVETDETARRDGEVLTGDHGEVAVFINTVPDTSVDRDALVKETGKQVFVIDAWYLDKLAKAMTVGRPDYSEMYPKMLRAMVAYQFATYAELCDGTHPVLMTQMNATV